MSEMEEMELEAAEARFLAEDFGMTDAPAEDRELEVIETEILWYKQQAGTAILEIGARLIEAKRQLGHGEWIAWLRDKVDFSERSAQNFMRLAKEYRNPQTVADLGASKALVLLTLPESEREGFLSESHTVNGAEKSVSEMSKRELEQAIRERDEARLAAETAQAERRAAETARTKMEADMLLAKRRVDDLDRQARAAERQAEQLRSELEELKKRPVEIAVQVDETALASARAEGEKAGTEARERELEEAQKRLAEAEAQAQELRQELEKARTSSALKEDPDAVEFNVYFKAAQNSINSAHENINRMSGVLLRVQNVGKEELAEKLKNATRAMMKAIREVSEPC